MTLKEFNALSRRCKDTKDWLDYRTALICTVIANAWRGSNSKPFTIEDFMPNKLQTKKQQTPEQMLTTITMLNATYGGKVLEN